jgi:hypothetical protein
MDIDEIMQQQRFLAWDPCEHTEDVKVHAILLILGWAFLIPLSVFTLTHLSRRGELTLTIFGGHFHMALGFLGAMLAIAGAAFGIEEFSTLTRDRSSVHNLEIRYTHAICGIIATAGCITNLFLFILMRPHQRRNERSLLTQFGHLGHRIIGSLSMIAAFIALETGTHMTSIAIPNLECGSLEKEDDKWTAALLGTYLATLVFSMLSVNGVVKFYFSRDAQVAHEEKPGEVPMGDDDDEEADQQGKE